MDTDIINIFKSYLLPKSAYAGGKGRKDVENMIGNKKLYKLSSNENILGPSPKAIKAITQSLGQVNEYPDRTDIRLRQALSKFYKGKLEVDQFFTENSGVSVLDKICRAFISEGNESIVCNPTFKPYIIFTKKCGGIVHDVPLIGEDFDLDVDEIIAKINGETRLIFITSPNNPTGTYAKKAQVDELIERMPDHVVLVYDEVYYPFVDVEDCPRGFELLGRGKKIIAVNSFSKAYGLAGMRIGYAYASTEIATYLRQLNCAFPLSTPVIDGAMAALEDVEFLDKSVKLVLEQKKIIYDALETRQIEFWKTQGNFIMIKPDLDIEIFEQKMLEEGIMVRPVNKFGAPGCVRVTIGTEEANQAYINALDKVL